MPSFLSSIVARVKRRYKVFEDDRKHSIKRRKTSGMNLHKQDTLLQSVEELTSMVQHLNECCVAKDDAAAQDATLWNPLVIETRLHRVAFQARIAMHLLQQQQEEMKEHEKDLQNEPAVLAFQRTQLTQASERLSQLAMAIQNLKNMIAASMEAEESGNSKLRCLYTC